MSRVLRATVKSLADGGARAPRPLPPAPGRAGGTPPPRPAYLPPFREVCQAPADHVLNVHRVTRQRTDALRRIPPQASRRYTSIQGYGRSCSLHVTAGIINSRRNEFG